MKSPRWLSAEVQPYYERGGITIYHGDCREILPTLGRRAIGIEIEEEYCEIAARRIEAARLTLLEPLADQDVLLFS